MLPRSEISTMTSLLGLGGPSVVHIVYFKFQADAQENLIKKTCDSFLALAKDCQKDGSTYMKSIKGGKDISIEGKSKGLTHAFVITFKSKADRDYYINEDQVHASFVKGLTKVEDAQVIDFIDGQF